MDFGSLPLALIHVIDQFGDDFEAAWRAGRQPRIEDYLATIPEQGRRPLLRALLASELELRRGRGEQPSRREYQERFPDDSGLIAAAFRIEDDGERIAPGSGDPFGPTHAFDFGRTARSQAPGGPVDGRSTTEGSGSAGPSTAEGPSIPGYHILGELGRGGMGVVYRAQQIGLNRTVALKMILAGAHAGEEHRARFANEAEAVARLQHPNIVQIFEVGAHEDLPYFSMEYVEGGSLAQRLDGRPLPPRQAAQLVDALARGIHAAHRGGIIHRDLKPANILLTAGDIPKIADFGLAKVLAGDTGVGRTLTGVVLGTPAYMAPEQVNNPSGRLGPACDIHALGAILYELLTGRTPYRGANVLETLEQVRFREPEPPRRLRPRLPRDLETICLKCLRKDPAGRYATAEDLADDLRAFLAGKPIQARRPPASTRAMRWIQAHSVAATLLAFAGVAVLGLLTGIWWHGALAFAGVTVLGLLAGSSWYGLRMHSALRALAREHAAAERHVERLHLLLEMIHCLMLSPDLDALLRLIGETTARLTNAERATIYLVDHERGELQSRVATGTGVKVIRLPIGVGIAGTVAATGESINIPDAYADPRFNPEIDRRTGYRTRNLLTLPMRDRQGRILGVFQILNRRAGAFTADDEEILAALGASASVALLATRRETPPAPGEHPAAVPGSADEGPSTTSRIE